jgi:hypothetical protein
VHLTTIARSEALHEETPITSPELTVVIRKYAAAAPIAAWMDSSASPGDSATIA